VNIVATFFGDGVFSGNGVFSGEVVFLQRGLG
jgi:hypothetical protein